ncbi:MAG TPA: hypothetical protein VF588_09955 [Pyrinomonadaceae bacterium]|jgi:hypothetical protein
MEHFSRRDFARNMLGALLAYSLVRGLDAGGALASPAGRAARRWLLETEELCGGLRGGKLRPAEWRRKVEELYGRVDLADLLRTIDYDALARNALFPEDHDSALALELPPVEGAPAGELAYVPFFIALKKGRAIAPHAHKNMASMHMVISGEARVRHFDRVADEATHLTLRPTLDKTFRRGGLSTVSDEQADNVHWFKALSDAVFIFSVGVFKITPHEDFTGRDFLDPAGGERLAGGLVRARRISYAEARAFYGNT